MSATTTTTTTPPPVISRELEAAFTRYYEGRLTRAGAITPMQKLAVLDELERELHAEGRVPLVTGPVKVPVTHPAVKAALEGRTVVLGGTQVTAPPAGMLARLQALPAAQRVLVLVAGMLVPLLLICAGLAWRSNRNAAIAAVLPTETATVTVTPGPTFTPTGTALPEPTATPYALALTTGDAAEAGNDPASVEIAGFSYVLGVGQVVNGEWNPQAAEWLADTDLHRVIAVPWEPNLANAVTTLRPGNLLTVRLRSGELAKYKISAVTRVQRQQIEVLAGRTPGLSVVLYGEPSDQRTVIIATALQSPEDFNPYLGGGLEAIDTNPTDDTPTGTDGSVPIVETPVGTPLPNVQTVLVTDTLTLTHPVAGIELSVNGCDRVDTVQEQPAPSRQEYLVCDVTLRNVGTEMARFTGDAFGITERTWLENRVDWMPTVNVSVTDALGAGTFAPGSTTRGRLVGLVAEPRGGVSGVTGPRSEPLLVWFQDGIRYLITLPE